MDQPIRVLQVVNSMGMGGAENFIMNVYRKIDRSKVQFDFAVHITGVGFFDKEILQLGGRIFHFEKFRGINLVSYRKQWQTFLDNHPEIVGVHGHMGSSAAIYLGVAKKYGLFTIAHSHNASRDSLLTPKKLAWKFFSYPTRYVAENRFACGYEAGISRYGRRFDDADFCNRIVNNGIDIDHFRFNNLTRKKIRQEFKVEDNCFVIGHVGRFTELKNHNYILEIFSALKKIRPNSELWLVGDGELRKTIEDKISILGLEDSVRLLGIREDVNELFMAFDSFIMPSIAEGLPVSMIEAQASGLPEFVSETIDHNADITGNVHFLPIGMNMVEKWTSEIINTKSIFSNREYAADVVAHAGYSIKDIAAYLQKFYLETALIKASGDDFDQKK